jgi:glutamyl-tRNA reductase
LSVVVIGTEHRQSPLDLLERVTLGDADLTKVLGTLRGWDNVQEAVVLSTCLRTEVYAVVDRFHEAVEDVREMLAAHSGLTLPEIEAHTLVRFDDDVALHLFSVAAGLESAIPGETEVLGQVRRAWERAQEDRVSGPVLAELFRSAVQTGKRVRSETGIARGTTSFSHAAVELAESRRAGGLAGAAVVVIGAGEMGGGLVRALFSLDEPRRPAQVVIANRSQGSARHLASAAPAGVAVRTVELDDLASVVTGAGVVFSAVEAGAHVLSAKDLAPGVGGGTPGPVLVVDLGVPRTVDPAASGVPGVTLLDMDDLRTTVERAMADRRSELERARRITTEELARYRATARARGAAPVIGALRGRLEDVRAAELERHRGQFGDLTPDAWEQVDAVTRAVLAKLLHEPTMVLRETAGTSRGERLVESLRALFGL